MLRNTSEIIGYTIGAQDGQIGKVTDFLFDDDTWLVRWLVVDTGSWLSGRKVLLPPSALGHFSAIGDQFSVKLTKQQVKDSPGLDTDLPVSRQMETSTYDYYGWNPYWSSGLYMGGYAWGAGGMSPMPYGETLREVEEITAEERENSDMHLRSVRTVTGYHIHASDGEIGHVADVLVEDSDWGIHYLVVDTTNWWPGKKVLVSPRSIKDIDWTKSQVDLNVVRQRVKDAPTYSPDTVVDRAYENHFNNYYGGQAQAART
jgi:sporulation protein YlmC with PRC-barrel domain